MWRKVLPLFAVCLVCLFSAQAQVVLENESRIILNEKTADVFFAIENPNQTFDGVISLELLDTKDAVRSKTSSPQKIKSGKETYKITLPLGDLMEKNTDEIAWFRLRYRVGDSKGIVSLSQILRDVFELRVIATDYLLSGMTYRSRIRATNPFTNEAVAGVKVNAELHLELKGNGEQKLKLVAQSETDGEGFAVLDFQIPIDAEFDDDGEIKITGRKNGVFREAIEELSNVGYDYNFLMLTDKPIYQPEQMLNVRGILLKGAEGKVVVPNTEVEFRITDEDGTVLYREKVKTSDFGIAAIGWKIPENAKLGNYRIRVKNQNQEDGNYVGASHVKISRYDLPNFVVNAKALKSFYLTDEKQAEVEVRADYLFGKPVTKGKVRVVRENSREWNWKEQKYDIEEGESHEGNADAEGKFTAKFDLSEAHEDLKDSDYYKFRDLKFTAYFTDSTTNKTEQRRFDVRVTREPIHVYFIGNRYDQNPNLPVNAYVSTFYADGTPAQCEVEIKGREEDTDDKLKTLQRLKTNSFGAGKIEFMRPKFEHEDDDLEIRITAKDGKGDKGTFGEEIYFDADEDVLRIETNKAIFKPGEAVKVEVKSTKQTGLVYVDVVKGWSVIDSYFANLKDGKAEVKIPYKPNFKGELKIAAFLEDEDDDLIEASRGIIFPAPQNLKVEAEFDKESYKPSEEARVNFSVLDSVGNTIESVLGVVIFDRAIEERARTESEFNGMFSNYSGWLGYGDSFGGVNVKDLNDLDLSKPIADELQLVAEVMFSDSYYRPNIFHSRSYDTDAKSVYAEYFTKQFAPIEKILKEYYEKRNFEHPTDEQSLRRIVRENGVNFDDLRDVWEQNYRAVFSIEKTNDTLQIVSAGADKTFGTKDDFTVSSASFLYFTPTGNAIDKAVKDFYTRTGEYLRDEKTLFAELGITELKDRFGRPYHIDFEVSGKYYLINFRSIGKDGIFEKYSYRGDDFQVFSSKIDYFAETEAKILKILQAAKGFPKDETEFRTILANNDLDFDKIRDGYGEKLYLVKKQFSRYTDKVTVEKVQKYGEEAQTERTVITPVTQEIITFDIRGKGADRRENSSDDLTFAQFTHVLSEQTKDDEKPKPVTKKIVFANGTGSISGTITDPNGAVIPSATVIVKSIDTTAGYNSTTATDENGYYLMLQIPAGTYQVSATASGFKSSVRTSVPVTANNTTKVDFTLDVGSAATTVDVSSDVNTLETSSTKIESNVGTGKGNGIGDGVGNGRGRGKGFQIDGASGSENVFVIDGKEFIKTSDGKLVPLSEKSTPRLREYFPETLVWNPELITDANGRATLNFKMADNITTWKLYTIASTKDGKIGVAEKEITAFQPFFVDLEPPKFLTDGDEIFLPTQVRNYTPTKQKVDVTMAKSDWFSFLNAETRTLVSVQSDNTQKIEVSPNSAKNVVFGFKAIAPVKDGKQRVTAITEKESDAIEKRVTVRPNGQEIVKTDSKLFRASANFDINFPQNALPKTPQAELKIYPNLMAHVTESVEGLLQRPYGCGEQTISSTYPNLMILKFTKTDNLLTRKAKKYLQKGYERLLGYQVADGGFSYWGGKDSSDIALTAYALRFLNDAKSQITIDEDVLKKAQNYLISQQKADGSFGKKYDWETTENTQRTKLLTTYVARTLAALKTDKPILDKALNYLKTRNAEINEPYALALFGLASFDAGNIESAKETAQKLEKIAIAEGETVYWNLETNTPFYGWGTAGRIETTALVLQLLLKVKTGNEQLISKATMFLLKSKDRYGVWYSTQTTINVLDVFLASLSESKSQTISVSMNGEKIKDFAVSSDQIEPVILDLSDKLINVNRLEITSSDASPLMAQIVATHYIDWENSDIANKNTNLRLDYKCDKLTAKILDEINCSVEAERIGFQGYGMLLAEIGLPPGADVSRESLENALKNDRSLSRYDILPDRIVLYMWSKAGGTKFNFNFKPRYAVNAQTPASVVYDYYNPEAQATIAPLRFSVK